MKDKAELQKLFNLANRMYNDLPDCNLNLKTYINQELDEIELALNGKPDGNFQQQLFDDPHYVILCGPQILSLLIKRVEEMYELIYNKS